MRSSFLFFIGRGLWKTRSFSLRCPDPESLLAELDSIRVQGYAIEHGEYRRGLMGAAAPIREHDGKIKYALGIVGLFRSVMSEEFQSAVRLMLKIAEVTI